MLHKFLASLLFLILFWSIPNFANQLSFNRYHSQAEMNQYMKDIATQNPQFVHFYNLGQSLKKREISFIVISNVDPKTVPAIYINGTHHGDEWSSTESVLGLIDVLVSQRSNPQISLLLNSFAIYLQPLVNPDGHAASTREDSLGRDPNRDYSYPNRTDQKSFSLPEIQLVKKLLDAIHPVAALAYHSGIEEILWPWCFTNAQVPQNSVFARVSQMMASSIKFDRFLQSYFDYATDGEFIDYAYSRYGTLALTFEVSTIKTPPAYELESDVRRSVLGALSFMSSLKALKDHKLSVPQTSSHGQLGHLGERRGRRLE